MKIKLKIASGGRGERCVRRTDGQADGWTVSGVFTEIMEDGIFEKSDKVDQSVGEEEQKLWKRYPRKSG